MSGIVGCPLEINRRLGRKTMGFCDRRGRCKRTKDINGLVRNREKDTVKEGVGDHGMMKKEEFEIDKKAPAGLRRNPTRLAVALVGRFWFWLSSKK